MRIHLIYAGDPNGDSIQAPYIITRKLYHFLKEKAEISYYNWTDGTDIDLQPNDILLGHPNYDPNTVVQKAFRSGKPCLAKCLIHPLHTNRAQDNLPFDDLARQADKIFSICGPYWYDTLEQTPFAHWKPKITRLDLAIDPSMYPYVKTTFNGPGNRRLVYIGSSTPNKNLGYLVRIMQAMSDVTLHWYGGDSEHPLAKLRNVVTTGWVTLNESTAREICRQCDIMVSTSDSDANPTTLLECAAWGIINACTKESGYYNDPMFTEILLDDFQKTLRNLRSLLVIDNGVLQQRSVQSRQKIENYYTWDRFCNTIWDELQKFIK